MIKDKFVKLTQTAEIKSSASVVFSQILNLGIAFLFSIFSARSLGVEKFGVLNFTLSMVNLFVCVASLGLDNIIIKEMSIKKDKNAELLGTCIFMRLCASALSMILVSAVIFIVKGSILYVFIGFLQSFMLIFKSFHLIDYWFQMTHQYQKIMIPRSMAAIFSFLIKLFILFNLDFYWVAASNAIDALLIAIVLWVFYSKYDRKPKLQRNLIIPLINSSWIFIISSFFIAIYTKIDQVMIGSILNDYQVGLYSVAVFFETAWTFIPIAIINSYSSKVFSSLHGEDYDSAKKYMKKIYRNVMAISVVIAVTIIIFAKPIIFLSYGSDFYPSIPSLRIIMFAGVIASLGSARSIWLIGRNLQRYELFFVIGGALGNILLNSFLIPQIGIEGAAIATITTQFLQVMIFPFVLKETRETGKIMWKSFLLK